MFQSHVVEVSGHFVGAAISVAGKLRFVAVDPRLEELDGSLWGDLPAIRRAASHLLTTGSLPRAQASA